MSQFTPTPGKPCAHLENCRLWNQFRTNSKFFWIKQYCEGDKMESCERLKLGRQGISAPADLLPNGQRLKL